MKRPAQTLPQYAERRFALAGRSLISDFNPFFVQVDVLKRECEDKGLHFLNFAGYDYLSIGCDNRVRAATANAVMEFGTGAGASRLVGGERSIHRELEIELSRFIGTEDALTMVSGYGTNVALVGHLLTKGDLILADEYSHNSIQAGLRLSRAECMLFGHNNLKELDEILRTHRQRHGRVLIIVEGLYSMEGDVPDLPALLELCRHHDAWLMVDEAHSIGVLGRTGRGICEHFGIDPTRIDLIVGTLSKSFASSGGFVCAKSQVIDWLRYTLQAFVYSVGLAPQTAATVKTAISIIEDEPHRIVKLQKISRYFVDKAREHNFNVGSAIGVGVVPIIFEDTHTTMMASKALLDAGIYVPPVVQIGVPKDMPRLRFFVSTGHSAEDIDRAFDVLVDWREKTGTVALDETTFSPVTTGASETEPASFLMNSN